MHTPEPDQICPAHWLSPVLSQALGVHPDGPLRLLTTVDHVLPADDHVDAVLTDQATGRTGTVRARFLVACDGASSPIRRACGIEAPGRHRTQVFRNVLFRAPNSGNDWATAPPWCTSSCCRPRCASPCAH
nr:FAD-dependent monooxygenase [Streptomyces sp. I6]